MAQFDVYRNPNPLTNAAIPFLLDVQANLLSVLATRIVVPLVKQDELNKPQKRLNLEFEIENYKIFMSTAELAGIRAKDLGEWVTSLSDYRDDIIQAIDILFVGI